MSAAEDAGGTRVLERNVVAVVVSLGVTGVLGVVYWGVAARLFTPEQVGRASAVVNGTLSLSVLANLSIGTLFERFLLLAGCRARALVLGAYALCGATSLLVGGVYVLSNEDSALFDGTASKWTFPLWVLVISWFGLLDQTSSGLRVATIASGKNLVHSVVKVAALFAAAGLGTWFGIVLTWMVPAAVLVVFTALVLARHVARTGLLEQASRLPPRDAMVRYGISSFWLTLLGVMAPLLLPLLVIRRVGLEANAYFSVTWSLVAAVIVILGTIGGPLVAEVVSDPDNVNRYVRRFARLTAAFAVAGAIGLAGMGPVLMGWIHPQYQAQTRTALYLFGAAMPFMIVPSLFLPLSRVVRRLATSMASEAVVVCIFTVGSWVLLPTRGISGVAMSFLAAQIVNSLLLAYPLYRLTGRIRRDGVVVHEFDR